MRVALYLVIGLGLCDAFDSNTSEVFTRTVEGDCNCSIYDRSFQKVLTRNKRWFVFPKGGNAVLTLIVTKTILDGRPRGLQESMEMELSYSVPPWVEGWRPTPILENNANPVKSAQQKIDLFDGKWSFHQWQSKIKYGNITGKPLRFISGRKHNKPPVISPHQYPTTVSKPLIFKRRNNNPRLRSWQYHREYRERRNIFQKFERLEKYLGINVKSCIKRAICEVKNGLLPEGESFIQDVARIIFTIPLDHEFEDDYVDSARDVDVDCGKKFSITCPFNPVEYLLRNGLRFPVNLMKRDLSR